MKMRSEGLKKNFWGDRPLPYLRVWMVLSKEVKTSLVSRTLYLENNKFLCAKIMLNMEKTVQMSDFIPDVVSLRRVKLYVMVFH